MIGSTPAPRTRDQRPISGDERSVSGDEGPGPDVATERTLSVTDDAGAAVLELLSDEYATRILEALSDGPAAARELATTCGISRPTVYRRLDRLEEHDLVATDTELDPDGHHRTVFESRLERAAVELADGPTLTLWLRGRPDDRGAPTPVAPAG